MSYNSKNLKFINNTSQIIILHQIIIFIISDYQLPLNIIHKKELILSTII